MADLDYMQILDDEFGEIAEGSVTKHGYCPACEIPMQRVDVDYKCPECCYTCVWEPEATTDMV